MKKLITLIIVCLLYSFAVVSQNRSMNSFSDSSATPFQLRITPFVSAGTSVGVSQNKSNTVYSTYIAPGVSYNVAQDFHLTAGIIHYSGTTGNLFLPNYSSDGTGRGINNSITGNLMFLGGTYNFKPYLTVGGKVMYDANNMNSNASFRAASLGVQYKVSDKVSVGVSTMMSNGGTQNNSLINSTPGSGVGSFSNGISPMGMFSPFGTY